MRKKKEKRMQTLVPLRHNDLKTEVDNFDKDMASN
jgi:hypothetical protein